MMHKEIEVYVDDMIAKSKAGEDHLVNLKWLFDRLGKYKLRLNPTKCTFGVKSRKLLGFVVSEKGIEVDPDKVKAIMELPPPSTVRKVRSFLGRLNYIAHFIANLTDKCQPLFHLLHKNAAVEWDDECQKAFDTVKAYLVQPPVLVPPLPDCPLILYLTVRRQSIGCMLGRKDDSSHAERAIYYLSKKFTEGESNYPEIEKMCCALVWVMQRLRQYTLYHTVCLLSKTDPLKYLLSSRFPAFTDRHDRRTLRRIAAHFFLSSETLYRRSFDVTLLRCVDENEAQRLMEEVHEGNCGPHMNGLMLAKKLMRLGYFWSTMETDCIKHVRHCHLCQVYANQIKAPPNKLHPMAAPWPFSMWGMDVIGPVNPKASNGHLFILVAIDYFTKWIEAITLALVTAKAVARFLKRDIIVRYG
ncbi:hypothetical protein CRG98_015107, partial [Punica granatum]